MDFSTAASSTGALEWAVQEQEPVAWIPLLSPQRRKAKTEACAYLLAGAAAMGKTQLADCLDGSLACRLAG